MQRHSPCHYQKQSILYSALEKQNCDLTGIVHVEGGLCLTSHFERETLAHDAVPVRTELAVHCIFDTIAGHLNSVTNSKLTYIHIDSISIGASLINPTRHEVLCFGQYFGVHIEFLTKVNDGKVLL